MSELLKINVNDHTEKKNGLTYLSWAWAWAEVLKIDADADWDVVENVSNTGNLPCTFLPDGSALVKTRVTIKGKTKMCWLPVMNHRNQAIKNPDAFAINTAIVRCLTKNISMFGLGLYIYAGEDLPEEAEKPLAPVIPATPRTESLGLSKDELDFISDMAEQVRELVASDATAALNLINAAGLEGEQRIALSNMLDSKVRSALKKAKALINEKHEAETNLLHDWKSRRPSIEQVIEEANQPA